MFDLSVGWTAEQWGHLTLVMHRQLRHDPKIAAHLLAKANECQQIAGDNFESGLQNNLGTTRARAYIRPANGDGIHDELADSVLLKAAAAMRGR